MFVLLIVVIVLGAKTRRGAEGGEGAETQIELQEQVKKLEEEKKGRGGCRE